MMSRSKEASPPKDFNTVDDVLEEYLPKHREQVKKKAHDSPEAEAERLAAEVLGRFRSGFTEPTRRG